MLTPIHWWKARRALRAARREERAGSGPTVIVVPGLFGGDFSFRTLRRTLAASGYQAASSGIKLSFGSVRKQVERVKRRACALHRQNGRPVQLLGHSLGGVVAAIAARELTREQPQLFAGLGADQPHVVTLGAPLNLKHKDDGAHPLITRLGRWTMPDRARVERDLVPLNDPGTRRIRLTTIHSVADALMYPEAATVRGAPSVALQEPTHLSLPFAPQAVRAAMRALEARDRE